MPNTTREGTYNTERFKQQLREGLEGIDKTGLLGKFKSCCSKMAFCLETMIKSLIWWFRFPPSMTSIGLYNKTGMPQLPLSSMVEEYKVGKAKLVLTLRDSQHDQVFRVAELLNSWESCPNKTGKFNVLVIARSSIVKVIIFHLIRSTLIFEIFGSTCKEKINVK